MEPYIRVSPTVTIKIHVRHVEDATARGGSFTMSLLEAQQLAERLDGAVEGEFKFGVGDTEFTITFDQPGERERFVAALRAATTRA